MHPVLSVAITWAPFILVRIILIVLVTSRKGLRGRPWLLAYLIGSLLVDIVWCVLRFLSSSESFDRESIVMVYKWLQLPSHILSLVLLCLLIPYVLTASNYRTGAAGDVGRQIPVEAEMYRREDMSNEPRSSSSLAERQKKSYKRSGWICIGLMLVAAVINQTVVGGVVGDTLVAGLFVGAIVCFIAAARVKPSSP